MFLLGNDWSFTTGFGLPYTWVQCKEAKSNGIVVSPKVKTQGLADVLPQGLIATSTYGKWTFAFGLRMIFPTAKHAELDSGKYRLLPNVGVKYDLKDWMDGAWYSDKTLMWQGKNLLIRYSKPNIKPYLNIDLPQARFLTFSPEIRYN